MAPQTTLLNRLTYSAYLDVKKYNEACSYVKKYNTCTPASEVATTHAQHWEKCITFRYEFCMEHGKHATLQFPGCANCNDAKIEIQGTDRCKKSPHDCKHRCKTIKPACKHCCKNKGQTVLCTVNKHFQGRCKTGTTFCKQRCKKICNVVYNVVKILQRG